MRTIDLRVVGAAPIGHARAAERERVDAPAATIGHLVGGFAPGQDTDDGC